MRFLYYVALILRRDEVEDPYSEYDSLFTDGNQEEDLRPPDSPYGFFPMGFTVELVPLALKIREKYTTAGVEKGKYYCIVIHGIESDSKASMQPKGDTDSLLPIQVGAEIAKEEKKCAIVSSKTGKLIDIDVEEGVKQAMQIFQESQALV
ncbi:hypothetical protein V6N12_071542 [Hibiscus sabdariffa]|uniref:Uncharacterized protein n=1 Tax=Hibiscus sabdariffa TaxID=183260 RepID=A0ABR2FK32_9ROSI